MDKKEIRGYKVLNSDWTCRGFKYEVGETYEDDIIPRCCNRGFHFCMKAADCFNYYSFDPANHVVEVIALGDIDKESNDSKCCTNKIKIVRKIPWQELLEIVNTGSACTGNRNSGNCNSGNCNSGNRNSGNCNSGNCNSGNCNSGNCNSGNCNSGNWNSGNRNSGNYNSGNYNSGDWNSGDWNQSSFNTGCFMTEEQTIMLFNKPSDYTYRNWMGSDARYLLNNIPKNVVEWIYSNDMTDKEKEMNPEYETTGGYLKVLDESESAQLWWDGLSESKKNIIKNIPNFDEEIFEKIVGIKID